MKEFHLLGKSIVLDECPVLMDYQPGEDWQEYWQVMGGEWTQEDGWLIGAERGNLGGILFSRESYDCDVIFRFTGKTVLPATRDLNALFCAHWNTDTDYLGNAYIVGLNGWYEHKNGIERSPEDGLRALSASYQYQPGEEVEIVTGSIGGHCFLFVDGELVTELIDPHYITGGHVGFSPYCTKLALKDIKVYQAAWKPLEQSYEPEF